MRRAALAAACLASLALAPAVARAALSDEIQVYTDDINAPGEKGLELHINTTPKGRTVPDFPGEALPHHGLRVTPEFSYGLTETWEAGLYIPTNRDASGAFTVAGAKLRLKWLPIRGGDATGGWFLGANAELSGLQRRFSESRWTSELRLMTGYRSAEWLAAFNTILGWNLSDGLRSGTPDVELAFKLSRKVAPHLALGPEYYSLVGESHHILRLAQQDNTLYAAADYETRSWSLNFGVGRGLTSGSDRYAVKAIVGLPF